MKKKLSVITGGSSGLGLASAQCLADKTALLLCARGEAGLAAAKKELENYGAEVYTFCMDVSDEDSVRDCAQYAASLGEIVNVIHAAGVSPANTAAEDILCINAMGPIYITEYFRPLLAEGGVLMLFSSTAGYMFETNEKMGALLPLSLQCGNEDSHAAEKPHDRQIGNLQVIHKTSPSFCLTNEHDSGEAENRQCILCVPIARWRFAGIHITKYRNCM